MFLGLIATKLARRSIGHPGVSALLAEDRGRQVRCLCRSEARVLLRRAATGTREVLRIVFLRSGAGNRWYPRTTWVVAKFGGRNCF